MLTITEISAKYNIPVEVLREVHCMYLCKEEFLEDYDIELTDEDIKSMWSANQSECVNDFDIRTYILTFYGVDILDYDFSNLDWTSREFKSNIRCFLSAFKRK